MFRKLAKKTTGKKLGSSADTGDSDLQSSMQRVGWGRSKTEYPRVERGTETFRKVFSGGLGKLAVDFMRQ